MARGRPSSILLWLLCLALAALGITTSRYYYPSIDSPRSLVPRTPQLVSQERQGRQGSRQGWQGEKAETSVDGQVEFNVDSATAPGNPAGSQRIYDDHHHETNLLLTGASLLKDEIGEVQDFHFNVTPDFGSFTVPVVDSALATHAKRAGLPSLLVELCKRSCSPVPPQAPLPKFCISNSSSSQTMRKKLRFDFSRRPTPKAIEEADAMLSTLPAVYIAIGPRFFGPGGQSYVIESIQQWRLFHEPAVSDVYLILGSEYVADPTLVQFARKFEVKLVNYSTLESPLIQEFRRTFYIQGYMHPGGTRVTGNKYFNQMISERFLALESLMATFHLENVLHLENDVMVYHDMRPLLKPVIACGFPVASSVANTKGIIPGNVFFRDTATARKFAEFIVQILSCGSKFGKDLQPGYANDMTYLMNFYQYYGSDFFGVLPSWNHRPGENCIAEFYDRRVLFDAASFGQWLSFSVLIGRKVPEKKVRMSLKGRFLDATPPPEVVWRVDATGRRVPFWKNYRLVTLHIHAKNLDKFRSK